MKKLTRMNFVKGLSAGTFWIPATRMFGQALPPISKQVRMAVIGAGGIGSPMRRYELEPGGATTVALCDVDPTALEKEKKIMNAPDIPCFTDYREMFDKMGREFDCVMISTPDHTHGYIGIDCMLRGKAIYIQKPLAPTVEECNLIADVAKKTGMVFQLGNQGHPKLRRYLPLRDEKYWGDILKIESWTGKTTTRRLTKEMTGRRRPVAYPKPIGWDARMPDARSWDLWCGPAADHGYSHLYHTFLWRLWPEYGAGGVHDMGVHTMDPAFTAFELGLPYSIKCQTGEATDFAYADGTKITMKFKPNRYLPNGVEVTWWDGEIYPERPLWADPNLVIGPLGEKNHLDFHSRDYDNGLLVYGSKRTTIAGSHSDPPNLCALTGIPFGEETKAEAKKLNERMHAIKIPGKAHAKQFVDAVRAGDPRMCDSNAEYSRRFCAALDLAALSTRFPNTELLFDEKSWTFTNNADANNWLKLRCRPNWDVRKLAGV